MPKSEPTIGTVSPDATPRRRREKRKVAWEGKVDFSRLDEKTRTEIMQAVGNAENFLGEGGAGKVFILEDFCIKLMRIIHKFIGNNPRKEFEIQKKLHGFNVAGVKVPNVLSFVEGAETAGILMEKLDAINLNDVLDGLEPLPKNFKVHDFFRALEEFVDQVHELGIIHKDLKARNIMIDRKTGEARVIDFGMADDFSDGKPADFERQVGVDFDDLNKVFEAVQELLDKE